MPLVKLSIYPEPVEVAEDEIPGAPLAGPRRGRARTRPRTRSREAAPLTLPRLCPRRRK